jgi:ABC-type transport system involved in multi-copper enzyme maturation permease subunit
MFFRENPVLQRELLVNLRMKRAFVLLFLFVALLGAMVYYAWPQDEALDMVNPQASIRLVGLFFLGQYVLASLMAPTFAAGAITGEKERKTYEMLLASPLRPGAVVLGKFLASLAHLGLLLFSSLPIVMLCLPLGGTSLYEVLAVYFAIFLSTATFGMISLACSSYFQRTAASLVVSYLVILPVALTGLLIWWLLGQPRLLPFRLILSVTLLPALAVAVCIPMFLMVSRRLLHPPDVGSEGKDVIDEEHERTASVGLVIRRDQFPDKLFAPPKRTGLLTDGANPVYDKEMRAEIFSQGTLMLRVVIQASMFLAIPLMAWCLYLRPQYAPWYVGYVVLFNMLVGPVFSAGSVSGERERQTLDLLLTTLITPRQILLGKLISGLRVSSVLTSFLLWPVALASLMVTVYWSNLLTVLAYIGIVAATCVTTATIAMFCSVMFRRSAASLMAAYLSIVVLFAAPIAIEVFTETFFPGTPTADAAGQFKFISPISAAHFVPLDLDLPETPTLAQQEFERLDIDNSDTITQADDPTGRRQVIQDLVAAAKDGRLTQFEFERIFRARQWRNLLWFFCFHAALTGGLLLLMTWLFRVRWRVTH